MFNASTLLSSTYGSALERLSSAKFTNTKSANRKIQFGLRYQF